MNKLISIFLFILSSQLVFAQQSDFDTYRILGGSIRFYNTVSDAPNGNVIDSKRLNFSASPYFGKQIKSNLMIGLRLDGSLYKRKGKLLYSSPSGESFRNFENMRFGFSMEVFARTYLNPDNKLKFYLEPHFSVGRYKSEGRTNLAITDSDISQSVSLGVRSGLMYPLNEKFNLILNGGRMYYRSTKRTNMVTDESDKNKDFNFSYGLSTISYGLEFKF